MLIILGHFREMPLDLQFLLERIILKFSLLYQRYKSDH